MNIIKYFFALSRIKHCVVDISTPAFCALLWLGTFPSLTIIIIGFITAFSAYTAVYAINDFMGASSDKEKFKNGDYKSYSIESTNYYHPIAQGMLSHKQVITWISIWLSVALIGSYYLNPIIVFILVIGGVLEIIYCLLLKITYLRILISGIVKACGPVAAIFVVDRSPEIMNLFIVFSWVFFWEVGGQNIPADWNDVEEDKLVRAKTVPIIFGLRKSGIAVLFFTLFTVILSGFLFIVFPANFKIVYLGAFALVGFFLLIHPAYKLYATLDGKKAAQLFDKASFYPFALLIVMTVILIR